MLEWLIPTLVFVGGLLVMIFREMLKISRRLGEMSVTLNDHAEHIRCIPDMTRDLALLNYRRDLDDQLAASRAADVLHSPTHIDRDKLMEKLKQGTLHGRDWIELEPLVEEAVVHETDPEKRMYAQMVLGKVKFEAARERNEIPLPNIKGPRQAGC